MQADCSLKDMLMNFLARKKNLRYPEIELFIVNKDPLQVIDGDLNKIELRILQKKVLGELSMLPKNSQYRQYKLVLKDWRFTFEKIPNSTEYYFDLDAFDWR